MTTRVHAGRGQGFVKHCLTLAERANDATRAPAYEPIPAASTKLRNHPCGGFLICGVVIATRVHAGRGQGFVKHGLALAERASDVA